MRNRRAQFDTSAGALVELPVIDGLLAGAAVADITPPPGLPKAGYSSNANDGNGFRTRLKARVLHLRAGRTSLAVVQCDLLGGSSVLQHLVAEAVAGVTDIPLSGIMIGATHTHAGPGQFLGTDFYNRFASNRAGFDPEWTAFLVAQIANAVVEAATTRSPAVMATGSADVWGWTRNRSIAPHVKNVTVDDERTEAPRHYGAINPHLHMVRVDRVTGSAAGSEPLAALVVFSVHGTGVSMRSREYNADLWAYLVGELDYGIEEGYGRRAVVGAIEGTHADIAPAIRPKMAGHLESQRVGRAIGREATALYRRLDDDLTDQVALAAAFTEIDLETDRRIGDTELPYRPTVGAALLAGAKENLTPIVHRVPGIKPGTPRRTPHPEHGEKRVLGTERGQSVLLPLRSFPRVLPVQILRLNDCALAGAPFEITAESGRRIAEAAGAALPAGVRPVVSSVANEYYGYVATAEEYSLQYYEGGHTLYGPNTCDFLSAHMAELASCVNEGGHRSTALDVRSWDLAVRSYWPQPDRPEAERRFVGQARFVDSTRTEDRYWEQEWIDAGPGCLSWEETVVAVEDDSRGGWSPVRRRGRVLNDDSWWFQIECHGPAEDGYRYLVRWFDPDVAPGVRRRFVLLINAGRPRVFSEPFG